MKSGFSIKLFGVASMLVISAVVLSSGLIAAPAAKETPVKFRFLPIGDSYTIGEGVRVSERWPNQLVESVSASGIEIELIGNPARSGWTTIEAEAGELPIAIKERPDLITLLIGTNDWVHEMPKQEFQTRVSKLLDGLQSALSPTGASARALIVIGIPDFSTTPRGSNFSGGRDIGAGLKEFNQVLEAEASKRNLPFVDLFPLSSGLNKTGEMVSEDGIHPSGKQYTEWTKLIVPRVNEALQRVSK